MQLKRMMLIVCVTNGDEVEENREWALSLEGGCVPDA